MAPMAPMSPTHGTTLGQHIAVPFFRDSGRARDAVHRCLWSSGRWSYASWRTQWPRFMGKLEHESPPSNMAQLCTGPPPWLLDAMNKYEQWSFGFGSSAFREFTKFWVPSNGCARCPILDYSILNTSPTYNGEKDQSKV